ncbi:hypothetical protein HS041_28220 [Planomonospora sp. ID67723]|uniref:RHS repeat-associated core domain-containing protein n=1 Tax=Planomonospora sp. ID67723 TaxID=2738134 RepID=UPI0018C43ED4|nr:RHS repeat-associated core domain-containing protein [Planomonospora sp. ID67723]MBG0831621.1 hypothetical protein [Planomonospora sp. ID67723]
MRATAVAATIALTLSSAQAAEASASLLSPQPAPAPKTPAVAPVTERPDRVSAALSARLQGSRVLVSGETSESSLTYANPDGTVTVEATSGPVRVRQGEAWAPIDTTLVEADGVLKPKAAATQVEFSAGGDKAPLAKLIRGEDESFALAWPTPLPKPRLEGNKATFVDAAGTGADLVVTALPAGFRHDVVLRENPAGPVEFKLPVTTEGLTLAETKQGGLKLTDDKGKTVASAPEPVMYDSPTPPEQQNSETPAGDRPEQATIDTQVTVENGQQMLVLKPDPAFLADPNTTYPVTVDPTTTLTTTGDVTVIAPSSRQEGSLSVGTSDTSDGKRQFARALIGFNVSSLTGQNVTDARLELQGGGRGCVVGQTIKAQRITSSWNHATIVGGVTATAEGEQSAREPGQCTGYQQVPSGVWTWPVTDIAKAWAAGAPGRGIQLRLATEDPVINDNQYLRSFDDLESAGSGGTPPKLVVTFGSTPATDRLRAAPIATGHDGVVYTNTLTPMLVADVKDPDGGSLKAEFEVEHDPAASGQGSGVIWSGAVNGVASGTEAKITVPAGKVTDGQKLRWRARASDTTSASAWSAWQKLAIDASAPAQPSIECGYQEGAWYPSSEHTPTSTECQISGLKNTSAYLWGLDDPASFNLVEISKWDSENNDNQTLTLSDLSDGLHTLYVKSRDRAHNTSTVVSYSFGVGPGGFASPKPNTTTQRLVTLSTIAPANRTAVRYEYYAVGGYTPIPIADVRPAGSAAPLSAWPQTRTDTAKNFPDLSWDLLKTLKDSRFIDGEWQIRACFSGGGSEACTKPTAVLVQRSAFNPSQATANVGPGTVALQTGDYAINATDAELFGIAVSRTHTTLKDDNPFASEETPVTENEVFGKRWKASFPAALSATADFEPIGDGTSGKLTLLGPDGATLSYVRDGEVFTGVGDAADGSRISINLAKEQMIFTGPDGAETIYTRLNNRWVVARVKTPAEESTISYFRDGQGRITRILAPVAKGVTCVTMAPGCRALEISYATATTATGVGSGWGDYTGLATKVSFTAFDPESNAMKTTALATYAYDSTGHLRQLTDPRTNLATTYYYTAEGRISQINPPGLAPWRMEYDSHGRIAHVQREGGDTDITQAVAYDVPIGGAGAPVDLTVAQTSKWGQATDLPVVGAALFPASKVPTRNTSGAYQPSGEDWTYAGLTYMDVNGRAVNSAAYGAGAWQISAARYDERGNMTWDLSASNRAQALIPTTDTDPYVAGRADSAERANLLANINTFSPDSDLQSSIGPVHPVVLASGAVVSARQRTTNVYDEGKPSSAIAYHLTTTTTVEPVVMDGLASPTASDRTIKKLGYDPIKAGDASGWTLRQATSVTSVMPGGDDIVQRTRYDATGRTIETRTPKSSGADAGTTVTAYYTAGTHPSMTECGNKPHWAGLACRIAPSVQPAGAPLPVETRSYNYYGQLVGKTETSGSTTRTTSSTFDTAGRITALKVEVAPAADGGIPVPAISYGYDPTTGVPTTVSSGGRTVTTAYDTLGRPTSYTDAGGNTVTTAYDAYGRPATVNDGKGTITFSYDGVDAAGKPERRGKTTRIDVAGVGAFGYAYDADGHQYHEVLPGGLTAITNVDNTGTESTLNYRKSGQTWLSFTVTRDVMSRTVAASSPVSQQRHTYDVNGRLTRIQDTHNGACLTRAYGFDKNSNRTSQASYPAGPGGVCSTSTTPVTTTHAYDAADRITDPGYTYDNLDRILTTPGDQVAGGQVLTSGYHANNMVASLSQAGQTQTFTLDPLGRVLTQTDTSGTATHHYATGADTPAWTTEPDGTWTRYLNGLGDMNAIYRSNGRIELQLANLHGDIVATTEPTSTGIASYTEYTEFGAPRETATAPERYGWLGSKQRAADTIGDVVLMGARVYNPATGRMLQTDPIPGACANRQDYARQDPVNGLDLDGKACYGPTYQVFDHDAFATCHDPIVAIYAGCMAACGAVCVGTLGIGCAPCMGACSIAYGGALTYCQNTSYKTCCKQLVIEKVYDKEIVCTKKKKGKCVQRRWRDKDTYRTVKKPGPEICW